MRPLSTWSWCFALCMSLSVVPAGAVTIPRLAPTPANSVAGTSWAGVASEGDAFILSFEPGGILSYTRFGTGHGGTWTQSGAIVSFEINERYSEHRGEIVGDVMTMQAHNGNGREVMREPDPRASSAIRTSPFGHSPV